MPFWYTRCNMTIAARTPDKMTGPPRSLLPHVLAFCESVAPGSTPSYVAVTPGPDDEPLACMPNVRRRIASDGGEEVLGWKIWEWYGVMIEAELHMLWRSPDGVLTDITPNVQDFGQVLFLPDATRVYTDQQVNNLRRPLISNPKIPEFIAAADESFAIQNEGDRATQFEISLSMGELQKLRLIEMRKMQLAVQIEQTAPGRNELCRCGSGRKYKNCCGTMNA